MASPNLSTLTRELDRQSLSVHIPEDGLAAARAIVTAIGDARLYRTLPIFEAETLESHGYHEDAKAWWRKVKQIDEDVHADLLRLATAVDELRRERFRRYWSAARVQLAVLHYLFTVSNVDGLPPISRNYLREASFVTQT